MSREGWAEALDTVSAAHRPLIAMDFDGTLAPFQLDPSLARIAPAGVTALARLIAVPELALALITGRSLADLLTVAEIPVGTRIVGDHGAQTGYLDDAGPVVSEVALTPEQNGLLAELVNELSPLAQDGAWVEFKTTSVVLHTRPMASRQEAAALRERARAIGHRLGGIVLDGKELIEFAVIRVTKGEALARLRVDHRAGIVLFAGDDQTDETAMARLTRDDIGIRVGGGPTAATLRMADPAEFTEFLALLADRLAP
ncbi:MAG: trehalose-phosphatase [Bifidobacteriaceae bacterium]|jgi:trehalose 6-phosphate phosphatase|nr:trehalose-phosphatase [Bifidobacteriaceae bacterium]